MSNPVQIRQQILEMCQDVSDARLTGNPRVLNAVLVDVEMVRLPKLIPDKPTLADVEAFQKQA
jgi:hypothetical protein